MSCRNLNMPLFRIQSEQGKMQERANSILGHFYPVLLTYMIKIYEEKLIFENHRKNGEVTETLRMKKMSKSIYETGACETGLSDCHKMAFGLFAQLLLDFPPKL